MNEIVPISNEVSHLTLESCKNKLTEVKIFLSSGKSYPSFDKQQSNFLPRWKQTTTTNINN